MNDVILTAGERIMIRLRGIYRSYGYRQYKVSKFEEYDFYMQNKRFLASEQVLAFSDTDGRLMALKPDITLSIIKNSRDGSGTEKVCYTENVYRVPRGGIGFSEIMQTGLECIGEIGTCEICEVLLLASRSLDAISPGNVLDVSDMGIITGVLSGEEISDAVRTDILSAFSGKNRGLLRGVCAESGVTAGSAALLEELIDICGPLDRTLDRLSSLALPARCSSPVADLREISGVLSGCGIKNLNLDFSVVNDMDYYNGIIFRGFVDGVPAGVLSGGRYDSLMARMGRRNGAIGFAVYMDQLERFCDTRPEFDADVLVLYDGSVGCMELMDTVESIRAGGRTVMAVRGSGDGIRSREVVNLGGKEAEL